MNQTIQSKIKDKIQEDISPTRNLSGVHLKIVFGIAILWTLFQLWYASPFPFWFNFGMFKGLPARAIHLGFALTLNFCVERDVSDSEIFSSKCLNQYDKYLGVKELLPYAKGISAKSTQFDLKGNETDTNFKKMIRLIKKSNFEGYMSIEYEGGDE